MNHVKFMFNRINNYDLLYEDIMEGNQEWGENTKRVEDHTKEYVTQVMKDIMPNLLNKSTLKCLGCLERIANEVFALETDSAEYKITFTIDTFQNKDARIIIDIVPKYIYEGIEKWYNGKWKAQSFVAVAYLEFVRKYRSFVSVSFVKVEAHTGNILNEEADRLAKSALGIGVPEKKKKETP